VIAELETGVQVAPHNLNVPGRVIPGGEVLVEGLSRFLSFAPPGSGTRKAETRRARRR
jgi:hypothetical protein